MVSGLQPTVGSVKKPGTYATVNPSLQKEQQKIVSGGSSNPSVYNPPNPEPIDIKDYRSITENMSSSGYSPVIQSTKSGDLIIGFENKNQTELNNKIDQAIKSGDVQGFSGTNLNQTEIAKAQLLDKVNNTSTPIYGEYLKAQTPKGQEIIKEILKEQSSKLNTQDKLKSYLPPVYYSEDISKINTSLLGAGGTAYPITANDLATISTGVYGISRMGILKTGQVLLSEPITEINQKVIDKIIPRQDTGFSIKGLPQQVGRGALFLTSMPLTGLSYGTELTKGLATKPIETTKGLYEYALKNPYETAVISKDILKEGIEQGSRVRLNIPKGKRGSFGDVTFEDLTLKNISPIRLSEEPLIKIPKFKDLIQSIGAKKGEFEIISEKERGLIEKYTFKDLDKNPLGIKEIILKDTPSQLSNEKIQLELQKQEKIISHVTQGSPFKYNFLKGESSFKVKKQKGTSILRSFSEGVERALFFGANEIETGIPQAYSYYAGLGKEASILDLISGKARIGKNGKPTLLLAKERISEIPKELLIENNPITRQERLDILKELDKVRKGEIEGLTPSDANRLLKRYGGVDGLAYHRRLSLGLDISGEIVPGVGALSGLRTEYEVIGTTGTKFTKYNESFKTKLGKLFGYGKLKTNEGIFDVQFMKKEIEKVNTDLIKEIEGKNKAKGNIENFLKEQKKNIEIEEYYKKPVYDISKKLQEISSNIRTQLSKNISSFKENTSIKSIRSEKSEVSNNKVSNISNTSNKSNISNNISRSISNFQSEISRSISEIQSNTSNTSKASNKSNTSNRGNSGRASNININREIEILNPRMYKEEKKQEKSNKSLGNGYFAYGKQIKSNKYMKINNSPVTRKRADDIGTYYVSNSLARSFKIVKAGKQAEEDYQFIFIPFGYSETKKNEIRSFNIRKGKPINEGEIFIQKNRFILNTESEKRQLKEFRKQASNILKF